MVDIDNNVGAEMADGRVSTTGKEEKKEVKMTNWQVLLLLGCAALLPSYLVPKPLIFNSDKCAQNWLIAFIVVITLSGVFNLVTLNILNHVGAYKQMDSYQEVAYNISNSNRGYIFLISAAKAIFLVVTAAYGINYCANYLTEMVFLGRSATDMPSSGMIYLVYMAFVFVVSAGLFVPFYRMRDEAKCFGKLVPCAYIFAGFGIFQFMLVLISMISASAHISANTVNGSMLQQALVDIGYIPK